MANIKDLIQSIESSDSSFDEKLAAINAMEETLVAMRAQEQSAIDDNVAMIVEAIAVMQRKVEAQLEVAKAIVPEIGPRGPKGDTGERGLDGTSGRDGVDGRDGVGGRDGSDGVSVTDAKIDFDGSLVITLSNGREMNVGEVVSPDLAERIKVISTMSTNASLTIQDEGGTITSGARTINFTGAGVTATASGDSVTVDVTGGGGAAVSSFSAGTTGFTPNTATTGAIVLAGTLAAANGGTGATSLAGASIVTYTGVETLTNKTFTGYTETVFALGTSGSLALNPANGTIQTCALTGNPTFTDSLATGQSLTLRLTNGSTYTVTWPTTVWVTSAGNVAPTLTVADTLVFWDIGGTLYGAYVGSFV